MLTLADIARGDQRVPRKDRDVLTATAPDSIAHWMITLHAWRIADHHHPMQGADLTPRPSFATTKRSAALWLGKEVQEVLRTSLSD